MEIYNRFKKFVKKKNLIKEGDKFLLGVSGGPDSLTMFFLFLQLSREFELDFSVFHLNHLFRKEASDEAEFVRRLCNDHDVNCFIKKFDVPFFAEEKSLSFEQAARQIRMQFLFSRAKKIKTKKIALAHNKDDLVETVFLHMIRGSALSGLTGIEPLTEIGDFQITHPLLSISRADIEAYCKEKNLKPRRDQSNQETVYTRNKIRHKIIPYIEDEINPSVKDVVARMASLIKEENDFLENLSREKLKEVLIKREKNRVILSLEKLSGISKVIKRRLLFNTIYSIKDERADIYFKHYQEIKKLFEKGATGNSIDLPGKITIKRSYKRLIIQKGERSSPIANFLVEMNIPGLSSFADGKKIISKVIFKDDNWNNRAQKRYKCLIDFKNVEFPLYIRNRREGDRFKPLGMDGYKKIKDFFIDEKVKKTKRDRIPIIVDNNGIIVWIVGFRIDDRVKVCQNTEKIIEITLLEEEDNYEQ